MMTYEDYCWDGPAFRQKDLTVRQVYDAKYLHDRYCDISENVQKLAAQRLGVLETFTGYGTLIDFGCGMGTLAEFACENGWDAFGYDIADIPRQCPIVSRIFHADVATFFDSLEHVVDPVSVVKEIDAKTVMISVPECHYPQNPDWFMRWKHRREGEHLTHWNRRTLDAWFSDLGYRPVLHSWFEDEFRPNPDQPEPNILTAIYVKREGLP